MDPFEKVVADAPTGAFRATPASATHRRRHRPPPGVFVRSILSPSVWSPSPRHPRRACQPAWADCAPPAPGHGATRLGGIQPSPSRSRVQATRPPPPTRVKLQRDSMEARCTQRLQSRQHATRPATAEPAASPRAARPRAPRDEPSVRPGRPATSEPCHAVVAADAGTPSAPRLPHPSDAGRPPAHEPGPTLSLPRGTARDTGAPGFVDGAALSTLALAHRPERVSGSWPSRRSHPSRRAATRPTPSRPWSAPPATASRGGARAQRE
jgi:hypothetical protein